MTLSSSSEVAIAIGFWPCGGGPCAAQNVQEVLGNVVYKGPYDPQLRELGRQPYENFTVQMPSHFRPPMEVSLGVAHFSLIGVSTSHARRGSSLSDTRSLVQAGLMPFLEVANITLLLTEA